ncbi:MAG TPA: serine/threonine-protein kinase [Polyangiaceae bacterium]|nr:serine/threonine-protein kinase [Polyangiaceae bacterium]
MHPQANWLVADRYFVGQVVGRGGYGMVCRGVDRKTGKQVALKMLAPEAGRDRDVVERMLREQQALVALTGTCAVTAIDLCRLESGAPCLVMEWLEGQDLEHQLSSWESAGQRGSTELLLSLLAPVTDTLERAHAIGIVHRDIKPANIFLTRSTPPGARLLDFGLASMRSAAPLTEAGMVMGSPSYIAPETWRGNSAALDGRADLFSLGVIVFRWLTGKLPFDAPDLVGKMLAVTQGPRPSAVSLRPELPASVDAWVARALAIEPQDRFQSGLELRDALAATLKGDPLPRPKRMLAKPNALVDAQQAFATALRSAAALLKHFSLAPRSKSAPPAAAAKAHPPSPAAAAHSASAGEPVAPARNTVWLDSNELDEAPKRNTLWLDSSELDEAPKRNTVWLDSEELTELGVEQLAQPSGEPPGPPPPPPNQQGETSSEPPPRPASVTKAKLWSKTSAKARPPKKAKARVSQRKRRKGPARKTSR